MTEWLLSTVTTGWGVSGIVLAIAAAAAFAYLPRLAPYVLLVALVCGALGYVECPQDDLDAAESALTVTKEKLATAQADAARNAETANANAAAAKHQADENARQAAAYQADAAQARTDRDRVDLARQAAELAAKAAGDCPVVSRDVHNALLGRAPEDAGIPAFLKAATEALRQAKGRRR